MGFTKSEANPNIYYIHFKGEHLILVLYVDNLFLIGCKRIREECKRDLAIEFNMKDLGLMHYFMGLEMWQKDGEIFLKQGKYTIEVLKRIRMMDCRPMSMPVVTK